MNGREEGGQYYISQTCDYKRFEARKVVFWWECLNISATGCCLLCSLPTLTNWHIVTVCYWCRVQYGREMFLFEATLAGYAQTISESFCAGTKIIPDFCSDISAISATDRWSEAMPHRSRKWSVT